MIEFESDIQGCLQALRAGGVILNPTDTVWGLGGDATNESAVSKIYAVKQRPLSMPLIVLVTEEQDILYHVAAPDLAVFDYLKTCSVPTTVVYEGAIGFAYNLVGADGSVAIRICSDPFCRALLKRFGKPIVSTSANLHGSPTPARFSDIAPSIIRQVDYVVGYRQTDPQKAQSSTLIRWEQGAPVILRS
ncbi:MAG: threonylcarbamoyl-AMP synthase [Bacteroidetes bacterium]|nr:threonylcarbamoyl-AMP synthase [Bacteroidota bacterium]